MARAVSAGHDFEPDEGGSCGGMGLTEYAVESRQKAVGVALAITSGAYQTSLLTYLIQRDMFPSVMKVWVLAPLRDWESCLTSAATVDTRSRNDS